MVDVKLGAAVTTVLSVYNATWSFIAIPTPANDYPLALPLISKVKSIHSSFYTILRSSLIYFNLKVAT